MQDKNKTNSEQFPDVGKDDWDAEQISKESTNMPSDEVVREMLRGDETKGDPDKRDVVGAVDSADTPQGREEIKNN